MEGPLLLLNPPSPPGTRANREGAGGTGVVTPGRGGFVYPSHRLAEASGWLRARGVEHVALDFVLRPWQAARRLARLSARSRLRRPGALVVQVSLATLDHDLSWIRGRRGALGDPPTVLTGAGLAHRGERIAAALPGAEVAEHPTGFRAAAAALGEQAAFPEEPDAWPDAGWEGVPLGRKRRLSLYHGRGCSRSCGWCPYVIATGRVHRARSPEVTAGEFARQVRRHRPRRVIFRDPVFGHDREGTLELLERLSRLERGWHAPFEVESRPELVDGGLLGPLARAGCVELKLGVETLEPGPLVEGGRVPDPQAAAAYAGTVQRVVSEARQRSLALHVHLLKGLPGSTPGGDAEARRAFEGRVPLTVHELVTPPVRVPPGDGGGQGPDSIAPGVARWT